MICVICKTGHTAPGQATVTLNRGETVVVIKRVPADVCTTCGEYYLDQPVAERVSALAEGAVERHAEVEIVTYAA